MQQPMITRREGLLGILPAFAVYALLAESRALAKGPGSAPARWIDGQQAIARSLAAGAIGGRQWCSEVERLGREVDLHELLALISRSRVRPAPDTGTNDPKKRFVEFLGADGAPRRLSYGVALFDFAPASVITPHGHRNMVSAHMVVNGAVRIRNFDRVGDDEGAMLIRPTRDYVAKTGHVSTMCSERDNIHWFVPDGGRATTFDVIISGLVAGQPDHVIQAVDPLGGHRLADGSIRAPIISFDESSRRYSAAV